MFIRKLHNDEPDHFDKIVHIFMGTLIEDFISSVTEIGMLSLENPVTAFYDTAVLLRQLGCSGKSLHSATEELTQYLQDLGLRICYFSGNEAEVSNILDTIVYIKDTGKELEGETAAAIADGEVTTTTLRMLQNSFPEQLARFNIFPAGNLESNALEAARFQIDETGFAAYLAQQAKNSGRAYGVQNRINDAGYLASVMRLRRGNRTRDMADCGFVFVTPNNFLAHASRRYLIEQKALGHNNFPPIISLGQIATIAWLLKDQTIPPEKAGRELLSNCFAAIRPDAEWFKFFREGIEKVVSDSLEDYSSQGANALTIQVARRIAQDESFGNSAIVRQLNMVEILSRAEEEQRRLVEDQAAKFAEERQKADQEKVALLETAERERNRDKEKARAHEQEAVQSAVAEAKAEIKAQLDEERRQKAHRRAQLVVTGSKLAILLLLAYVAVETILIQNRESQASITMWVLTGILAVVSMLAYADLLKLHFMEPFFEGLQRRLAKFFVG